MTRKPKSELAKTLDALEAKLRPTLISYGFRGRYRTYNRTTSDGLTEVVRIQMGPSDPPGTTYFPPIRVNLYGMFTINLGVFVPEVTARRGLPLPKSSVPEYECCVRARLGELGPEGQDVWWGISAEDALADELRERLARDGLPFLRRFSTRDAILQEWLTVTENQFLDVPPIVCAIILAERGDHERANELLMAHAKRVDGRHPAHAAYVRRLAEELN